jgi:hypothetical protein
MESGRENLDSAKVKFVDKLTKQCNQQTSL